MLVAPSISQTLRSLRHSPGYTLAAVLTLALGIGASTAIFSLLYGALLRPLPYPEPERLIRVHNTYQATGGSGPFSTPNFLDIQRQNHTLEEFVGFSVESRNLATEAAPDRARILAVTANFFDGLGMRPVLGRGFEDGEDREAAPRVAVIGSRVWQDRFAGSPDVLGQIVRLNGVPYTVLGVLPASFWFPGDPQIVLPFAWGEDDLADDNRGSRWLQAFGRLQPGVSEQAASQDLATIVAEIAEQFPANSEGWTTVTMPFREYAVARSRTSLLLLTGAVGLVLLIGCVNVANLMLVRSERRQREMALRAALGAGRGSITACYLMESMALAGLAVVVGLGVAGGGIKLLLALYGSSLPRAETIALSAPVVLFAAALALVTGVAVGLVPAIRIDMSRLQETLREGGAGAVGSGSRVQRLLVGFEVAVAVVLVAGAGLLMTSFRKLSNVDTGVDPEHALVFRVQLPEASYGDQESIFQFFQRTLEEIGGIAGVQHVGITPRVPLQGGFNITTLPSPDDPELEASFVEIRQVSPDFFRAAGIPLLKGRSFLEAEARPGSDVAVVSDVLAETIFPHGNAIGKRILTDWNDVGWEIVGIVGSVREFGVTRAKRPAVYWPYPARFANNSMTFIVRTAGDPHFVLPEIRQIVRREDPNLPLYGIRTMEDVVVETVGDRRFATSLFSVFGAVALTLAAVGIFGVLAYVVEQRTREIGIRMAMGADTAKVVRLVALEGGKLVVLGLIAGFGIALASSRLLSDLLYEVEPTDPVTLAVVVLVTLVAAALAAAFPARRAAKLQPMAALREE
jgi:putative ABC transport system permease protein